ncbi:hypothetical protein FACS1894102_0660 [Spirochaetia bacterium]|nr:hypothetical protein FACS1894102_0660 [Spirochaetia bacterium]
MWDKPEGYRLPSLKQLETFRKAFENVGFEKTILEEAGQRPDAYDLPENEPIPIPPPPGDEDQLSNEDEDSAFDESLDDEISSDSTGDSSKPDLSGSPTSKIDSPVPPKTAVVDKTRVEKPTPVPETPSAPAKPAAPAPTPTPAAPAPAPAPKPAPPDDDDEGGLDDDFFKSLEEFANAKHIAKAPDINTLNDDLSEGGSDDGDDSGVSDTTEPPAPDINLDDLDLGDGFGGDDGDDSGVSDTNDPTVSGTNEPPAPDINLDDLDLGDGFGGSDDGDSGGDDSGVSDTNEPPVPDINLDDLDLGDGFGGSDDSSDDASGGDAGSGNEDDADDGDIADEDIPNVDGVTDEELSSLVPNAPSMETESDDIEPMDGQDMIANEGEPKTTDEGAEDLPDEDDSKMPDFDLDLPPIEDLQAVKAAPTVPDELPKKKEPKVEPINLSEEDLQNLLDTIASYPLNLRIATEKVIAEEAVPPAQLSALVKLLVNGASARETAALVGKITKKKIDLPKSFKTGEDLEDEQNSFRYIFIHKFFPIARLAFLIAALAASLVYLSYIFIYKPLRADSIYKQGYARISDGEYSRANQLFNDAFAVRRVKNWFYKYAEAFRDERQYILAENKYEELLKWYPHDKKGALDYAAMEKDYLRNYEKADSLIRTNILDYSVNDPEGLLALGDINLDWGDAYNDKSRYEEARQAYAKYITAWGQSDPILERMLKYFIRTDQLGEVIPLQMSFMGNKKSKISAETLAELGGYLLDKHFEVTSGVPDENIERIGGIKDVLLRAVKTDPLLPESHYHLARYYNNYGAVLEERQTLQNAASYFDAAKQESPKRSTYRIDTQRRIADLLIKAKEFLPAEEALVKGVGIYEDALNRRLLTPSARFGQLYADLGDLEYFAKTSDMQAAINFYLDAERNLYAPNEVQYRLGSAYYHLGNYQEAQNRFWAVLMNAPYNRRLLNAMGNVSYMNSEFYAAQGYYQKLLDLLEADRNRFPMLMPAERPEHHELVERMMTTRNNLGVTLNSLAARTGNPIHRARALALFAESARAWDNLERDQKTMIRPGALDSAMPGVSLPYLNIQNTLHPIPGSEGELFMQIDKDVNEPSAWEELMSER